MAGDNSSDIEMDSKVDALDLIGETEETCLMMATTTEERQERKRTKRVATGLAASSSEEEEQEEEEKPPGSGRSREEESSSTTSTAVITRGEEAKSKSSGDTAFTLPTAAPEEEKEEERATVVISTTEVHKMQELISCLKHRHRLQVQVRYLGGASGASGAVAALASPRMGVDRRAAADFCSAANRRQVLERCQALNDLFERPCVVLEEEQEEEGVVPRRALGRGRRTQYADTLLSQLSGSKIRVLYSSGQAQTASVLAALARRERARGMGFPGGKTTTSDFQERAILPFYRSLPGVSAGAALALCSGFSSLSAFLEAAPATVARRACVDADKARRIHEFVRRRFQGGGGGGRQQEGGGGK